jgi:hypothetical protein
MSSGADARSESVRNRWRVAGFVLIGIFVGVVGGAASRQSASAAGGAGQGAAALSTGPASRLIQLGEVIVNVDHVRDALYNEATDEKGGKYHTLVIHMDNDERITVARHNVERAWADLTGYIHGKPAQ